MAKYASINIITIVKLSTFRVFSRNLFILVTSEHMLQNNYDVCSS